MESNTRPALMTPAEAARLIGRDPRTISGWARQNHVPNLGVVIAGRLYVRRHVIESLISGPMDHGASQLAPVA